MPTNIRHKLDNRRVVEGVEWDRRFTMWTITVDDVQLQYSPTLWEEESTGRWSQVTVSVDKQDMALMHGGTHVAGIVNRSYRFQPIAGGVKIEQFT